MYKYTGSNYDSNLTTKEIASIVREKIKEELKDVKFSVSKESYSGGSSITVALMEAPFDVLLGEAQKYVQVNQFYINDDKRLTDIAKTTLSKAYDIANSYNYDDSDPMTDYFNNNFFIHLQVGKWDKPFVKTNGGN